MNLGEKLGKMIDLERELKDEPTKSKNHSIWIKIHGEIDEQIREKFPNAK